VNVINTYFMISITLRVWKCSRRSICFAKGKNEVGKQKHKSLFLIFECILKNRIERAIALSK